MWTLKGRLQVLDFDIECRPLGWYGGDFVHKEVTAIAAQFVGHEPVSVWLLGEVEPVDMLRAFVRLYDAADIVTGHYIRGFDLPTLNGALLEFGLPPLKDKLTQDTKLDLMNIQGLSQSQENLGSLLGLDHPKVDMNMGKWRQANRLEPVGLEYVRERVVGDVRQHIELRAELLRRHMLKPPTVWRGDSSKTKAYHA